MELRFEPELDKNVKPLYLTKLACETVENKNELMKIKITFFYSNVFQLCEFTNAKISSNLFNKCSYTKQLGYWGHRQSRTYERECFTQIATQLSLILKPIRITE